MVRAAHLHIAIPELHDHRALDHQEQLILLVVVAAEAQATNRREQGGV